MVNHDAASAPAPLGDAFFSLIDHSFCSTRHR